MLERSFEATSAGGICFVPWRDAQRLGKGTRRVIVLFLIGFVAGVVAGISPCIIPVLPVVLAANATARPAGPAWWRARPVAVVGGLVSSFAVSTLFGSWLLSELHLPQDLLRDLGLAVLGAVALGLLVPRLGHLLERPFAAFGRRSSGAGAGGPRSGFVLGLGLGVLFVPCAGPVLAAITTVSVTHRFSADSVFLTAFFASGTALPLLAVALAGDAMSRRLAWIGSHGRATRRVAGGVLLVMLVLLAGNLTDGLQRSVPGYTSALQRSVEANTFARGHLASVTGTNPGSIANCTPGSPVLQRCGKAPGFRKITSWINTPGGRPLTLAALRGKVVLIDFWTYSCINCQRALPHVEAWYARYRNDGLEVVGVHSPEFAFEHVVSNVRAATARLGVRYPVAVDDQLGTWNAYANNYWPAEYLIDATGVLRHVDFGEGGYSTTEFLLRQLLSAARPGIELPPPTEVADKTPQSAMTPESYLGYDRLQNYVGTPVVTDRPAQYQFPAQLPYDELSLEGTWTVGPQKITAGTRARLELSFNASDVYLVLGGSGTVTVTVEGAEATAGGAGSSGSNATGSHNPSSVTHTVSVSGIPDLYTLFSSHTQSKATLLLSFTPGLEAYDFTFG